MLFRSAIHCHPLLPTAPHFSPLPPTFPHHCLPLLSTAPCSPFLTSPYSSLRFGTLWRASRDKHILTPQEYKKCMEKAFKRAKKVSSTGGGPEVFRTFDLFAIPDYFQFLNQLTDPHFANYWKTDSTQLQWKFKKVARDFVGTLTVVACPRPLSSSFNSPPLPPPPSFPCRFPRLFLTSFRSSFGRPQHIPTVLSRSCLRNGAHTGT